MDNQENHFPEKAEKEIEQKEPIASDDTEIVIPVIHEFVTFDKEVIETGKIRIHKRIEEDVESLNVPVIHEEYEIKRVKVNSELYDQPPATIERDGNMIIHVVREVAQVVIKYEVTEEIHVIKNKREVPHVQQIILLKEEVDVDREQMNQ